MMEKSKHAEVRGQQRCISDAMIDILQECGKVAHFNDGCRILHLHDKRAKHKARKLMVSNGILPDNHLFDVCAIISKQGEIITLEWRWKRIMRDWNPRPRKNKRKRRR